MPVLETHKIVDEIKQVTIPVTDYRDDFLGFYQCMRKNIDEHQELMQGKLDYIDLIVAEDLYQDYKRSPLTDVVIQTKEREIVDFFIIGNFERNPQIIWELSEVFADFYVEFLWMPVFHAFNYTAIATYPNLLNEKLAKGILIYES